MPEGYVWKVMSGRCLRGGLSEGQWLKREYLRGIRMFEGECLQGNFWEGNVWWEWECLRGMCEGECLGEMPEGQCLRGRPGWSVRIPIYRFRGCHTREMDLSVVILVIQPQHPSTCAPPFFNFCGFEHSPRVLINYFYFTPEEQICVECPIRLWLRYY